MAKTEQISMAKVSETLEAAVKEIEKAIELATSNFEKTALKTYKGTIKRVAEDLKQMAA